MYMYNTVKEIPWYETTKKVKLQQFERYICITTFKKKLEDFYFFLYYHYHYCV